jgi:tetratricopeptide (TPR) repeat protein
MFVPWKSPRSDLRFFRLAKFLAAVSICFYLAAPQIVFAQHEGHGAAAAGWVPAEILNRPVPLRKGIGSIHDPVTTSSPQAQSFYDQGLAYLHSYVWIEAARSFHQALRLDPSCAMAYIGLSDAYVGLQDLAGANDALAKAQTLAPKVSEAERSRIAIRAAQLAYLANPQNTELYFAYRKALNDALAAHPDDPWLWILLGFASEGTPTAHGQNGGVETIAYYRTALSLSPDNFAAHHYLVHSYETIGRTPEALEHAKIYAQMAPEVPHARHMYGHDLRRGGRTEEALAEFVKANELEEAYYRAENIPAKLDWHHAHNLSLLAMCAQSLGKMKMAEGIYKTAFVLPAYVDISEYNRREWPAFLLHRNRPQEALDAANAMIETSEHPFGQFAGHALAGRALLALDRIEDAKAELTLAERETEQLPVAILGTLPDAVTLRGEILLRTEKQAQGRALLQQVEKQIRSVPGPDAWNGALFELESIAQSARKASDWELADFTAQQMLQHDPSYAGSHYEAALVAQHHADSATATREFAAAEKLWSSADSGLPELARLRESHAAAN